MGLFGQLLLQIILIALNAFFACAEIAVISMNDAKLATLAAQGDRRAKRLKALTAQPSKFLATIQVAITLAGFFGSAFAAENFSDRLTGWIYSKTTVISYEVMDKISVVLITLVLSYFTLVLGELVPKRLAMKRSQNLALTLSGPIYFVAKISAPIVWLLTASTNGVLRLFGVDPNAKDEEVSEEEIKMMVDAGSEQGVIDMQEQEIIHNLFEFDDKLVTEFATHRTDMVVLWMEDSVQEWEQVIRNSRHSYYPLCEESADNVVGILNSKDYFRLPERTKEVALQEAVRPPYFVPESITADVLFRKMKSTRYHFAVVIDEYGGTSGIVTMNDLLEQLVGDLEDSEQAQSTESEIRALGDDVWEIVGTAPLEEVAQSLDIFLPSEDYDTFGGYVFGLYGSVPDDGNVLELDTEAVHITVQKIENHRVVLATVTKKATEITPSEDEA